METIDQDYQVEKLLGEGLAGEVYLVQKDDRPMALKLLKTTIGHLKPAEAQAHFKAEFSLLKQLSHPNIAKILDFGNDGATGRHYFTSEFVKGSDLFTATREASLEELENLFIQALRALEYLHAHGIAHFDLKPENILVERSNGQVKIIDFGLAGFRPRGQLAGTPAYMAPEVVLGNAPDHRADLYSLGLSFYECFCGENPFRAESLSETLRRQEKLTPPNLREKNPQVPEALVEILERLLKKNPGDRPATAGTALRIYGQLSGKTISLETESTSLSYLPNETQLINRREEMETFQKLFEEVFNSPQSDSPPHHTLVLCGKSGMGKSRLLKEFRYQAQLKGVRTFYSAKPEIPKLSEPACLLFDDQTPDQIKNVTLQILTLPVPVLLVVATEAILNPKSHLTILSPKSFTPNEIKAYLSALTGLENPPKPLVEELNRRTQGSPQFLTDILSELIRKGSLFDESGRWSAENLEDLGIDFSKTGAPEQLKEKLMADFQELDKPAQIILRWISMDPLPVPADLLSRVSQQEDLSYWLLELLNKGFLKRLEDSQSYQVLNPYLSEFIVEGIPDPDREKMHQKWAEAMQQSEASEMRRLYHLSRSGSSPQALDAAIALAHEQNKLGNYATSLETFQLADSLPNPDLERATKVKIKIGETMISLNKTKEAATYLDQMLTNLQGLPEKAENIQLKVTAYEKLGVTYLRLHNFPKAEECVQAGLKLLEGSGPDQIFRLLTFKNYLGRILQRQGNLAKARDIFKATHEEWTQLPSEQKEKVINNELGEVLLQMGAHEEAARQFKGDFEFFKKGGNLNLQAKFLYHLAETHAAQKNEAEAISDYEKCIEISKAHSFYEFLLRAYNGLGNLYHHRREYDQSLNYYERALAIAQKIQDFSSQASLETNLGIVLRAAGKAQEAGPHLVAASNLVERLGLQALPEKFLMATALSELVEVYREAGQLNKAEEKLLATRDLVHKNQQLDNFKFSLDMAEAKLHFDQGNPELAQKCLEDWQGDNLSDTERTEFVQTKNYLSQKQGGPKRKAAVTQTFIPGSSETRAMDSTMIGQSDYAKLLDLTKILNAETNLDFVLKNVLRYALELSRAERGLILLLDEQDRLEVRASINTDVSSNLSDISTRVAEQVLQTGEMIETDDASNDQRFNEYQSVMILKLRSILCLPIHSRNKTVGVLYLDNRYRPSAFEPTRIPLLQAFCDQAGMAIENAKLFERYELAQAQLKNQLDRVSDEAGHYHELLGETSGKILPTKYSYDNIVARSKPMYEVFKLLDKITETNISVFINGETGTGKELIAKALHYNNKLRSGGRFVAINCGGIPANLIESELFGYKAGAFTGASKDKKGLFVEADGGTLFMDEAADLDLSMQVKLLRALEEGEVTPVGDTHPVRFDIRVVSASHKNLEDMVEQGKFREDLFYRLCQIRIPLPPLRDRKEDIEPLVQLFTANYAKENKLKKSPKVTGPLMKKFIDYDWPGNIRELENTVRVCAALGEGGELTTASLPANFGKRKVAATASAPVTEAATAGEGAPTGKRIPIDDFNFYTPERTWEEYEKLIFSKVFASANFKPTDAAKALGVSTATFYKRIKDFNLNDQNNPIYQESFVVPTGKTLREFLEDIVWAAYQCAEEKSYTAINWLSVSQGHFYNVLKSAKKRYQA